MLTNFQKTIDGLYTAECDLDLNTLRKSSLEMEKIVKSVFRSSDSNFGGTSTETTKLYAQYNLCLYPLPMIHELYWAIHGMFHTCLSDHFGKVDDKFVMQSWLNVYRKGEYIDWHSHTNTRSAWHGFFCVDVEPKSSTFYRWKDSNTEIEIESKNNLIVMGLCNGDEHKSSVWNKSKPRITIAFDILPIKEVHTQATKTHGSYLSAAQKDPKFLNHLIPI
jgi:hypothetical protein